MLMIKIFSALAFIGSVVWFIKLPDYEPAIAIFTSFATFIAVWFGDKKLKCQVNQSQAIAKNSIGIQAGGDVNVGSLCSSRKGKDAE